MKYNMLFADQPLGRVFMIMASGKWIYKNSTVDRRSIEKGKNYIGIQRKLGDGRVNEIAGYINSAYSTFPNSVILSVKKELVEFDYDSLTCEFKDNDKLFEILDGQHRIFGFGESLEDFDIPVCFYVDLNTSKKSIVFNNINYEQTPVSSSMSLELEGLFPVYTPEQMLRNIVVKMNLDENSPYFKRIRLRGLNDELTQDGLISLSAIVKKMLSKTYLVSKKHDLRDFLIRNGKVSFDSKSDLDVVRSFHTNNHFLWDYYFFSHEDTLYKIFMNYFKALSNVFEKDWLEGTLLTKAVGFNALFKIFEVLYKEGVVEGDLTEEYFFSKIKLAGSLEGKITSSNYGSSASESLKIEKLLLKEMGYKR